MHIKKNDTVEIITGDDAFGSYGVRTLEAT